MTINISNISLLSAKNGKAPQFFNEKENTFVVARGDFEGQFVQDKEVIKYLEFTLSSKLNEMTKELNDLEVLLGTIEGKINKELISDGVTASLKRNEVDSAFYKNVISSINEVKEEIKNIEITLDTDVSVDLQPVISEIEKNRLELGKINDKQKGEEIRLLLVEIESKLESINQIKALLEGINNGNKELLSVVKGILTDTDSIEDSIRKLSENGIEVDTTLMESLLKSIDGKSTTTNDNLQTIIGSLNNIEVALDEDTGDIAIDLQPVVEVIESLDIKNTEIVEQLKVVDETIKGIEGGTSTDLTPVIEEIKKLEVSVSNNNVSDEVGNIKNELVAIKVELQKVVQFKESFDELLEVNNSIRNDIIANGEKLESLQVVVANLEELIRDSLPKKTYFSSVNPNEIEGLDEDVYDSVYNYTTGSIFVKSDDKDEWTEI